MTVVVLPGMGANSKMYSGPWSEMPDMSYLDWAYDTSPDSILGLAEKMAESLKCVPTTLVGSSLGGMVALEMATILKVKKVILIGSATSSSEISPLIRALSPLTDITPFKLIQTLTGKSNHLLSSMYADQKPDFIRSMIKAVLKWDYSGSAEIIRIHGSKDPVIKCKEPNYRIDGGHLLAITNADECSKIVSMERLKK